MDLVVCSAFCNTEFPASRGLLFVVCSKSLRLTMEALVGYFLQPFRMPIRRHGSIGLASVLKHAHNFEAEPIEPQRLHISLFFLGRLPIHTARIACEAAAELRVPPFDVLFDRSVSFRGRPGNRPFVLLGDDGLDGLRSFRQTLAAAMARNGLKRLAKNEFVPHITLIIRGTDG